MKYSLILVMLITLSSFFAQPILGKSEGLRTKFSKHNSQRKKCCKEFTIITAGDINRASLASPRGLILEKSGNYKLCENVDWAVSTGNSFAITLTAENITLDLDGHYIKQSNPSLASNFGIQIDGSAKYVHVHNGVLQQLSGGGLIVQAGASCVTVDRVDFNSCCYNGQTTLPVPILPGLDSWASAIFVNGSPSLRVDDLTITNCNFCDNGILGALPVWFTGTVSGTTLTLDTPPLSVINTGFAVSGKVIVTGAITNNTLTLSEAPPANQTISVGNVVSGVGIPAGTMITATTADPRIFIITSSPDVAQESITIVNYAGTITGTTDDPRIYTVSPAANVGPEPMIATDPQGAFIQNTPTMLASVSSIFMNYASHVTVRDCILNGNFGYGFSFALDFVNSFSVLASKLSINDVVTFGLAKGGLALYCRDISIEDAAINRIFMTVSPDDMNVGLAPHGAEGIKMTGSNDWSLRRVSFKGNRVQTAVPTALRSSELFPYLNCSGLMVDSFPPGTDIPCTHGLIEDCSSQDMRNDGGQVASNPSYSAGFNMSSEFGPMNTMRYSRCTASDITGSVGWAYGFGCSPVPGFQTIEDDIIYKECTAEDISITGDGNYAAGFVLTSDRNQVIDCTANRIIDERAAPAAFGIILDNLQTGQANSSIISNNLLTFCSTYALFDNTTLKNAVITGNYAVRCGPGGAGPNYFGLNPAIYTDAIQQNWLLSGPPAPVPPSGSVLANVDAHN
jgi:hypothetical protein